MWKTIKVPLESKKAYKNRAYTQHHHNKRGRKQHTVPDQTVECTAKVVSTKGESKRGHQTTQKPCIQVKRHCTFTDPVLTRRGDDINNTHFHLTWRSKVGGGKETSQYQVSAERCGWCGELRENSKTEPHEKHTWKKVLWPAFFSPRKVTRKVIQTRRTAAKDTASQNTQPGGEKAQKMANESIKNIEYGMQMSPLTWWSMWTGKSDSRIFLVVLDFSTWRQGVKSLRVP